MNTSTWKTLSFAALIAAVSLAGCGGGGTGSSIPPAPGSGGGGSTQSQSENAISVTNALGSPVKDLTTYNNQLLVQTVGRLAQSANGTCTNGVEFFAPDRNGDPNSTETLVFYDSGCTQLARDTVRIYTQTSPSSETVNRTETLYAAGNATPIATRSDTVTITNATFDQYGFPLAANGFDRVATGYLSISGTKTIDSDGEFVMLPASNGTNTFCADSAGFNATGIQSLNETFGWSGGVLSGGARTVNSDGSVTWTATHTGTTYKGAIGSLSIGIGTQNTSCPISTPMFTLNGGTSTGSYTIPVSVTYKGGIIQNLTVTNAQLANGNTLNVTTNSAQPPTSNLYITGVISNGNTQIATFGVDAFGNGTLTVTATGAQYVITDWHVVK
jgi:hypothetical protein